MPICKKNSLRKQIKEQTETKHPELTPSVSWSWFRRRVDYLNRRDRAWLVPFIVVACYVIFAYSPLPGLMSECKIFALISFDDIKSAATLIDQRTSNIATIISMTLAVTAILLSNMAIKETLVYDLLYKRSKLNLIIFYTLSVIGSLIIVGTTKDSYPDDKPQYFYNGVLTGTYLVLLVLVMIGYLFKVVYDFSSSTAVKKMLSQGLRDEAREHLKTELFLKAATDHVNELFRKAGFSAFNYLKAFQNGIPEDKLKRYSKMKDQDVSYIHDIHLEKFSKVLTVENKTLWFFRELSLERSMDNYSYVLLMDGDEKVLKDKNAALKGSFILKPVEKLPVVNKDFQKYFEQKLKDAITGQKRNEVAEILGYYREIHQNELKHIYRK